MPGVDLSAVNGPELRRLLKIAHARRDGLLADRLEWEIAERRATSIPRPAPAFERPADDDQDELDFDMAPAEAQSFTPAYDAPNPASGGRSLLLVTLGAVAGALGSAGVFWGLERMDGPPSPGGASPARAESPPMMAMGPAEPAADQVAAALAPQLRPPLPLDAAPAAPVEAPPEVATPAPTPSVEVAKAEAPKAAPKRKAKLQLATNAERPPRPPNLAEWLAKPEPAQHIDPDAPIY